MAVSSVGKANLSVPFSQRSISRGKWVGENRGGCAIESQERSREKKKKKKKKKSKARFQIFANNTRNTAYKTRWNIPSPPSRACLRYIGFCESINLAYVTSMLILMQRDCNAVFQHKTENILDSFYRRVLKMCRQ